MSSLHRLCLVEFACKEPEHTCRFREHELEGTDIAGNCTGAFAAFDVAGYPACVEAALSQRWACTRQAQLLCASAAANPNLHRQHCWQSTVQCPWVALHSSQCTARCGPAAAYTRCTSFLTARQLGCSPPVRSQTSSLSCALAASTSSPAAGTCRQARGWCVWGWGGGGAGGCNRQASDPGRRAGSAAHRCRTTRARPQN